MKNNYAWMIFFFIGLCIISFCFTMYSSITNKKYFSYISSNGFGYFIELIENNVKNSLNPFFPTIHIKTNFLHDGWIHVVYTDSFLEQYKVFIDSVDPNQKNSIYPFYTHEKDFYDAPLWAYSFFQKPLSVWKGNAFAVRIDRDNKMIYCFGGIEWGFDLKWFHVFPSAKIPQLLDKDAWIRASKLLNKVFCEYEYIWM